MKLILSLLILISTGSAFANNKPACGKVSGLAFNQDNFPRPYRLSGFWVKQATTDIRVTYGNSPELIEAVEKLEGSLFVCLDKYTTEKKKYAGKNRSYATVSEYRIWANGELAVDSKDSKNKCDNLDAAKSALLKHINKNSTVEYSAEYVAQLGLGEDKPELGWSCYNEGTESMECEYTAGKYVMEHGSAPWEDCWISVASDCDIQTACKITDI